jgi:ATP-dependent Clp protease ATP-binding subunit ClpC
MFENFTDRARRVISYAIKLAQQVGADYVDTEHLLLGLHQEPTGLAAHALRECGAEETSIQDVLRLVVIASPSESAPLPFAPQAKCALEESIAQARRFGHPYIGTEHILLGLLKDPKSAVARVLKTLKVAPQAIVVVLYELLGFDPSAYPEVKKVEAPTPVTLEELNSLSNSAVAEATIIVGSELQRVLRAAAVDEATAERVTDLLVSQLLWNSYTQLAYFIDRGRNAPVYPTRKPDALTSERLAEMHAFMDSRRDFSPNEQNEIVSRILGRA